MRGEGDRTGRIPDQVEIDGSMGEGGGQVLRTALALSAVTCRPVRISNIRKGRKQPGLRPQHLQAVRSVGWLCGADLKGDEVGSTEVVFVPDNLHGEKISVDIGTAGSTTLLLQALLPPAVRTGGESHFMLSGGTDVRWSPQADYMTLVMGQHLKRMGASVTMGLCDRGYYPKGGGLLEVHVAGGAELGGLHIPGRGELKEVYGTAHAANVGEDVPAAVRDTVLSEWPGGIPMPRISIEACHSHSPGYGVTLAAVFEHTVIGVDVLGEQRKGSVAAGVFVGKTAVKALLSELDSGSTVDIHASDMLLPFMAMARTPSMFTVRELTAHASTNMETIRMFMDTEFTVSDKGGLVQVSVVPARRS